MEEDIKILEDYIKLIKKGYCEDCNELCNIYGTPTYPAKKISEAIENLINRDKELEEENQQLEAIKDEAIRRYNLETIPKQKLKDKIEEILNNGEYTIIFEGDADFADEATRIDAQKYIKLEKLQELLELESEE